MKHYEREAEDDDYCLGLEFADPGGRSALRAGIRNRTCPTCGGRNRLTAGDQALGYQCDSCADALEYGWEMFNF